MKEIYIQYIGITSGGLDLKSLSTKVKDEEAVFANNLVSLC